MTERRYVLFVYGTLLRGESAHARLDGANALGDATTAASFHLVDLGPYPALVEGGTTAVLGELYEVNAKMLGALDVYEEVPRLFKRVPIALSDGAVAETYTLDAEQTRGRRRIRSGDWRARFGAAKSDGVRQGAMVQWMKNQKR
jgi:gamma-glutamylcyclotransferase (GGCT)/AIG2-like uncharacterized protein YtfP